MSLRAMRAKPEPSHDFIENQNSAVLGAELTHTLEVAGFRQDAVHIPCDGLGDNTSDLIAELIECLFECVQVVKGQCHGVLSKHIRDAWRAGYTEGERT